MVSDSWCDPYRGVTGLGGGHEGLLRKGQRVKRRQAGAVHPVERVGGLTPKGLEVDARGPGDVGFLNAGIKTVADTQVGDTITDERRPAASALAGFKPSVSVVFCGLFPADAGEFEHLRDKIGRAHV